MALALYHPILGYYNAERFDLGKRGDFITAPEISPLFAECMAETCLSLVDTLGTNTILELGAGTGRFAKDMLEALHQRNALPDHYYIYDISVRLREKQQQFLKTTCPDFYERVIWLEELPSSFTGVVIANEVLDALPVHCFALDDRKIQERCVAFDTDHLTWQTQTLNEGELFDQINLLRDHYGLSSGYQSEINLHLSSFIKKLADSLTRGIILLMDYGYGQREYYRPERRSGTLSCIYQHKRYDDPLIYIGQQDITAHVDFTRVAECALNHGLTLHGYTTQAAFLLDTGLLRFAETAEKNLSSAELFTLRQAIKRLTLDMGERVKVIALAKDVEGHFLGFREHDRRWEL